MLMDSWPPATTMSESPLRIGLIAERDRAQTRAAELVDAPGRAFHRNAGGDRGLARRVLALRRGQNLAHDDFGDAARLDARPLQRRLDGDGAEIVGRVVANAPLKLPTGVRAALTMTTSSDMDTS